MITNFMYERVRLPRKAKKKLAKECGPTEFEAQSFLIRWGELSNYIL